MERRGALIVGSLLVLAGACILLINLNILPSLSISQMWPGFVVLVGILFWLGFIFGRDHDAGLAFAGTIVTLVGLFFFLFTLNVNIPGFGPVEWSDMGRLWPAFPLIVGVAFVVLWIAGRFRDAGVLIPAAILLLVGFGGFAFTLGNVPVFQSLFNWWPLLLIVFGVIVLIQSIVRGRSK